MNANKFKNMGKKISQLSFAKKFWLTFGIVIFIWQAVCFVQGAITARAMNYYCEKEAGIELAKGTYFMEISKDEYQNKCYENQPNLPFYCRNGYDTKRQWIEVKGSLSTDINLMPTKPHTPSNPNEDIIRGSMGGIIKETANFKNVNNIVVYRKINFSVNANFSPTNALAYNLFRNGHSIGLRPKSIECNSFEIQQDDNKNQSNGLLVNRG